MYVADNYLEKAEKSIENLDKIAYKNIADLVQNAFNIYTSKLGGHNWADENVLRIANIYRDNGFEDEALRIENAHAGNIKKEKWHEIGHKVPLLPSKNNPYLLGFEWREKMLEVLVSDISNPIKKFFRRYKLRKLNDRLLYAYSKVKSGDLTAALDIFAKERYLQGIGELELNTKNADNCLAIAKTKDELLDIIRNDEIERRALLKENIRLFITKYD